jgi:hypothetical protein
MKALAAMSLIEFADRGPLGQESCDSSVRRLGVGTAVITNSPPPVADATLQVAGLQSSFRSGGQCRMNRDPPRRGRPNEPCERAQN